MKTTYFSFFLLALSHFAAYRAAAQAQWEVGSRVGMVNYQGDLIAQRTIKSSGPNAGLYLAHNITQRTNIEANIAFGAFLGNDQFFPDKRRRRTLSSLSYLYNGAVSVQHSLWKNIVAEGKQWSWTPFVTYGFGVVHTRFKNIRVPITSPDFGLTQNTTWCAPIGGGVRFLTADNTTISLDFRFYATGSDLLEGVSHSANPKNRDTFAGLYLSIGRRF